MVFQLIDQSTKQPLTLVELFVDVTIHAFVSKTSVTLIYKNFTEKDIEGELIFPLEDVREKKSGPALAEHVSGNVFKTRIYPIRAHQTRTIRLGYLCDLDTSKVGELTYKLPLETASPVKTFALEINLDVSAGCGIPLISSTAIILDRPSFRSGAKNRSYQFSASMESANLKGNIVVTIPNAPTQQYMIQKAPPVVKSDLEEDLTTLDTSDEYYFVLCDILAGDLCPKSAASSEIKNIGIFWDCSISRLKTKQNREKDFGILEALCKQLQNIRFFIFELRESCNFGRFIHVSNASSTAVVDFLKSLEYDGGTDLDSVKFQRNIKLADEYIIDYYLLFTDGFSSMGTDLPKVIETPVYSFASDEMANHSALKVIAQKSNGDHFNTFKDSNFNEISQKIGKTSFGYVGTRYAASSDSTVTIMEVFPQSSATLKGKSFKVAGKIRIPENLKGQEGLLAEITVCYGFGSNITQSRNYKISVDDLTHGNLLSRYWAQKKLDELLLYPEIQENQQIILDIGRQYNLITPNTSFLVLETLDQYVKHEVTPPDSLPDMKFAYLKIMAEKRKEKRDLVEDKIQMVLDFWERRVEWWNSSYEIKKWQPDIPHCVSHRKTRNLEHKDHTNPLSWKPEESLVLIQPSIKPTEQLQENADELSDDFDQLLSHPFFAGINQNDLLLKNIAVPSDSPFLSVPETQLPPKPRPNHRICKVQLNDGTVKNVLIDETMPVQDVVTDVGHKLGIHEGSIPEFSFRNGDTWLDPQQSFREQGIGSDVVISMTKKFFCTDALISNEEIEMRRQLIEMRREEQARKEGELKMRREEEIKRKKEEMMRTRETVEKLRSEREEIVRREQDEKKKSDKPAMKPIPSKEATKQLESMLADVSDVVAKKKSKKKKGKATRLDDDDLDMLMELSGSKDSLQDQKTVLQPSNVNNEFDSADWGFETNTRSKSKPKPTKKIEHDRWEIQQLLPSASLSAEMYPELDEELSIELEPDEPAFLQEKRQIVEGLSPINIIKNSEGSVQRAALSQSALAAERRQLREQSFTTDGRFSEEKGAWRHGSKTDVANRTNEIAAVEKSVQEVKDIFSKLSSLVQEQGQMIDNIDVSIDRSPPPPAEPGMTTFNGVVPSETTAKTSSLSFSKSEHIAHMRRSSITNQNKAASPSKPAFRPAQPVLEPRKPSMAAPASVPAAAPTPQSSTKASAERFNDSIHMVGPQSQRAPSKPISAFSMFQNKVDRGTDDRNSITLSEKDEKMWSDGLQAASQVWNERRDSPTFPRIVSDQNVYAVKQAVSDKQHIQETKALLSKEDPKLQDKEEPADFLEELFDLQTNNEKEQASLLKEKLKSHKKMFACLLDGRSDGQPANLPPPVPTLLDEWNELVVIGKSSSGKVMKAIHKQNNILQNVHEFNQPFKPNKDSILQNSFQHPFVVEILKSFSHDKKVHPKTDRILIPKNYMITESLSQVMTHLQRQKSFSNDVVRLLAAEVAATILHFHKQGTFQSLFPENVWVDKTGHLRVVNTHLLLQGVHPAPWDYLAPEVLQGRSPTRAADWWSLGIFVHHLLCGESPYNSNSSDIVLNKIFTSDLAFSSKIPEAAQSLIRSLLEKDPAKRLGIKQPKVVVVTVTKSSKIQIQLQPWKPFSSFGKKLGEKTTASMYQTYLQEREKNKDEISFFVDTVMMLWNGNNQDLAVRVLTSMAELELENTQLLRIVGYFLEKFDKIPLAVKVFRKIKKLRGEEPQSLRDLAIILVKSGKKEEMEESMVLFKQIIEKEWHPRFHQIEVTTTTELNRSLNLMKHKSFAFQNAQNYETDKRFLAPVDVDIRVVLYWDSDNTNVELICEEPNGDICYTLNNHSKIGGMVSRDFTGGYGPVEYLIKKAGKGDYKFKVRLCTPGLEEGREVTAFVKFFTNYGRPVLEEESIGVVLLSKYKDNIHVGTISVP